MDTAPAETAVDETLKALASPVRRRILAALKEPEKHFAGQEHPLSLGVCAGQIGGTCGLSQSTVSGHLAILQQAGLISGRRIGQWVFYTRNEAAIGTFLRAMSAEL
ncbi:MAG TPA: metalloregulator ArsR/SmtB family transcription factor [Acetobacteraceae bacterium]|nr:metalloregulator ArsR/SmtB family transcription factor [Acetobacteraceae bacterium]